MDPELYEELCKYSDEEIVEVVAERADSIELAQVIRLRLAASASASLDMRPFSRRFVRRAAQAQEDGR